jgi:predicted TIM-barrel fold metal-dependent hydrolase
MAPQTQSETSHNNFIDAHVHVWTDDLRAYPQPAEFAVEGLPPVSSPREILRHATPSGVHRIILVQMVSYGFDNSYMLDVIQGAQDTFAGVAVIDWRNPNPATQMRDLAKRGIRGFRIYANCGLPGPQAGWEDFDAMFRTGAEEGLAMCPLLNPNELPAFERQCACFPQTPVIIDHLARIGANGTIAPEDVQALCELARHPNVKLKVSAFYALGKATPPHLDLAPLIRQVYDAFGPRRLMWGTDFPFAIGKEPYDDTISLIRDHLEFLSDEDKQWILGRTAGEVFFGR